jgi:hypothetical protein
MCTRRRQGKQLCGGSDFQHAGIMISVLESIAQPLKDNLVYTNVGSKQTCFTYLGTV